MNIFKEQVNYLKNNPNGYWFRRKLYGWGWTPARLPGWLTLVAYVLVVIWIVLRVEENAYEITSILTGVVLPYLAATAALIGICLWKGESPRWQWGVPEEKDNR